MTKARSAVPSEVPWPVPHFGPCCASTVHTKGTYHSEIILGNYVRSILHTIIGTLVQYRTAYGTYGASAVGWSIMKGQYNDKRIDII